MRFPSIRCFVPGLLALAIPLQANVLVDTSVRLTSLQISPSAGSIQWITPLSASAFVEALDSLGGSDQKFGSADDAAISLSALTTLASANAGADAVSRTATADSHVNIPAISAFASSTARGTLNGNVQTDWRDRPGQRGFCRSTGRQSGSGDLRRRNLRHLGDHVQLRRPGFIGQPVALRRQLHHHSAAHGNPSTL